MLLKSNEGALSYTDPHCSMRDCLRPVLLRTPDVAGQTCRLLGQAELGYGTGVAVGDDEPVATEGDRAGGL